MEKEYFTLGATDNNRVVKVLRILFGIICIGLAVYWMFYKLKEPRGESTLWIAIIFLAGFGFYEIWSGTGRAIRFIEIDDDFIRIRKNSFLPVVTINSTEIIKLDLYPMNLTFFLKSGKKVLLRFGSSYHETNEKIIDAVIAFADKHNIDLEVIEEKL